MIKSICFYLTIPIGVILLILFNFGKPILGATTSPIPTPPSTINICSDRGGINCSAIRPDALVVCNDGTVHESFVIYAVPQCQETIANIVKQQSDFMAQSGCYPPSEMGCFNEQSYQGLHKILVTNGLASSELGKSELSICRQQIGEYRTWNKEYKQCLLENDNPEFDLPNNRLVQPILKAIFCPIFYGPNSSYNPTANLCLCGSGYFTSDGWCTEELLVCQSKYGPSAYAKNGNCYTAPMTTVIPTPVPTKIFFTTPPRVTYTPPVFLPSQPTISIAPRPSQVLTFSPQFQDKISEIKPNFIELMLDKILSGIKNILKLW